VRRSWSHGIARAQVSPGTHARECDPHHTECRTRERAAPPSRLCSGPGRGSVEPGDPLRVLFTGGLMVRVLLLSVSVVQSALSAPQGADPQPVHVWLEGARPIVPGALVHTFVQTS